MLRWNQIARSYVEDFLDLQRFGAIGDGFHDDGPALQAALTEMEGTVGAVLYIPPGRFRIATPVSQSLSNTNNPIICGAGAVSQIIPDFGSMDPLDCITLNLSAVPARLTMRDLIFLSPVTDGSISVRNVLVASCAPFTQLRLENVNLVGIGASQNLVSSAGGIFTAKDVQALGCGTGGLANAVFFLDQVTNAHVEDITHLDLGNFGGRLYNGSTVNSLVRHLPALPNGGNQESVCPGYLGMKNIKCDEGVIFVANVNGANRSGRVEIDGVYAQIASLDDQTAFLMYRVDQVDIRNAYVNTIGNPLSFLADLYNVRSAILTNCRGEPSHQTANAIRFDPFCDEVIVNGCLLQARAGAPAGVVMPFALYGAPIAATCMINGNPLPSQAGSPGADTQLLTASTAIVAYTGVKVGTSGFVAQATVADSAVDVLGVSTVNGNTHDCVSIGTQRGKIYQWKSDGTGAITAGDPLTLSTAADGRVVKAIATQAYFARAMESAPAVADTVLRVMLETAGVV